MTSSESVGAAEAPTDPQAIANLIEGKPPVPLLGEETSVVDRFGSLDVAIGLADIIEKVEPPFTISISGAWGVGKTTLARQLRARLEAHEPHSARIRCVEIDLWAEDIPDLRRRVALEVAVELQDHESAEARDAALKTKAKEFDKQLRGTQTNQERAKIAIPSDWSQRFLAAFLFVVVIVLIYLMWGFTTPTDPSVEATGAKAVVTIATAFLIWVLIQSGLVLSVVTSSSSLQPVAEKVGLQLTFKEEVTKHKHLTVLVILDNLDRLTGVTAVEALGEIRSFVEFDKSRCIFLVPLDREALERHLRLTMGGDDRSARDYLDKFFNLDILLTKPVASDLRGWTRSLLAALFPGVELSILSPVAEYAALAADSSPRATKRILNGIYSRAYLLPQPSEVRIDELAVVEALVARFPTCVGRLNAEPHAWLAAAESVRSTMDPAERRPDLRWLLGKLRSSDEGQIELEDDEYNSFVRFLLLTRNVVLRPESIRAILSLRSDRQWASVYRGDEASAALQTGDAATLAAILEDTPADDRHGLIRVAIDQIAADLKEDLSVGVLNGINALSFVIDTDPASAADLRNLAAQFLATADPRNLRLLTPVATEYLFADGLRTIPYAKSILDRSIGELGQTDSPDTTSVVRILAVVATDLDAEDCAAARPLLAKLSDKELGPLFGDVERSRELLVGEVDSMFVNRLVTWDASEPDQDTIETAAQCLGSIRAGDWRADDAADRIAARAATQIPSLPDSAQNAATAIAAMLRGAGANANIDTFALALAQSPTLALFKIGLGLASDPTALRSAATRRLSAAGLEEFLDLVRDQRARLEASGVDPAEIAAARWAAGLGSEYARVTLSTGQGEGDEALALALAGVSDQSEYVAIVDAVLPVLVDLSANGAAERIVADIAGRVPTFKEATLIDLAPVVRGLQGLAHADPVIAALLLMVSNAPFAEIHDVTSVIRAYVETGVDGSKTLPPVLSERGAALGTIDVTQAQWLLHQTGVRPADVRTSLISLVRTESAPTMMPTLAAVRSRLGRTWQIGKALVERAATSPEGSREDWLLSAEAWNVPSGVNQRQARDEYRDALDQAAEDSTVQEIAARIRRRL